MKSTENWSPEPRHIIGMIFFLIGIVLIGSSLYNGFWVGAYAKATFHGLAGFVLCAWGLNCD